MAAGLTLVFGVMRLINIAHAAIIILASYLSWQLLISFGLDPLVAIPVMAVLFFIGGAVVQAGLLSALADRDLSLALLATLGIANVIEGLQGVVWTSTFHAITTPYSDTTYHLVGLYVPFVRVLSFAVSL